MQSVSLDSRARYVRRQDVQLQLALEIVRGIGNVEGLGADEGLRLEKGHIELDFGENPVEDALREGVSNTQ